MFSPYLSPTSLKNVENLLFDENERTVDNMDFIDLFEYRHAYKSLKDENVSLRIALDNLYRGFLKLTKSKNIEEKFLDQMVENEKKIGYLETENSSLRSIIDQKCSYIPSLSLSSPVDFQSINRNNDNQDENAIERLQSIISENKIENEVLRNHLRKNLEDTKTDTQRKTRLKVSYPCMFKTNLYEAFEDVLRDSFSHLAEFILKKFGQVTDDFQLDMFQSQENIKQISDTLIMILNELYQSISITSPIKTNSISKSTISIVNGVKKTIRSYSIQSRMEYLSLLKLISSTN